MINDLMLTNRWKCFQLFKLGQPTAKGIEIVLKNVNSKRKLIHPADLLALVKIVVRVHVLVFFIANIKIETKNNAPQRC